MINQQPCTICGKPITDQKRYRVTCGDPACQEESKRLGQAVWRQKKREGTPAKELFPCEVCGKVIPRKKITNKTCGSLECRKEYHRRINRVGGYRGNKRGAYRTNGLANSPHEGPPTRWCPRCGKPSYEWKYCDHCRAIVRGMSQAYTEDSLLAG